MRVLVIGHGDFVDTVCDKLEENKDKGNISFFLITKSAKERMLTENYEIVSDYSVIDEEFLQDREIEGFDRVIISLPEINLNDAVSIVSFLVSKDISVLVVVPKAKYKKVFENLGAEVIIPEVESAIRVIPDILFKSGPVELIMPFLEDYYIAQVNLPDNSRYINKQVRETNFRKDFGINIIFAYQRAFIPMDNSKFRFRISKVEITPTTVLTPNISLIVAGTLESIRRFVDALMHES